MSKGPYSLEPDTLSSDTVECLAELLEQAKAGKVIGIAFSAILKRRNYWVNTAGEARRSPTFTRGMLRALDDQLGQRVSE